MLTQRFAIERFVASRTRNLDRCVRRRRLTETMQQLVEEMIGLGCGAEIAVGTLETTRRLFGGHRFILRFRET